MFGCINRNYAAALATTVKKIAWGGPRRPLPPILIIFEDAPQVKFLRERFL
jgi:hypothetical protein